MKILYTISFILLSHISLFSQEKEFDLFKNELNFYIKFQLGKIDSIPVNSKNQTIYCNKVDQAFLSFVLNKNSHQYEKLIVSRDNANVKFINSNRTFSMYVTAFNVFSKTFLVYSYKSVAKQNYLIKDQEENKIVYQSEKYAYYVDNLCAIDSTHVLLIEQNGDFNTSRTAMVLSIQKGKWNPILAFDGNAFGQYPVAYFKKKYVKRRVRFQLECEFEYTMSAPNDINLIQFDYKTKTLSYKQYSNDKTFKWIKSKWEQGVFKIDDYNVSENLSRSDVAVPY
jgi:hypothetical protein